MLLLAGLALLVAPSSTADAIWPWELTPLTGRAIGAWLVALAIVLVHAVLENDWRRIPVAPVTYGAVGILQLVVVARYADDLDWSDARTWIYGLFFASVAVAGAISVVLSARARVAAPGASQSLSGVHGP
jgi:hypothetical protein